MTAPLYLFEIGLTLTIGGGTLALIGVLIHYYTTGGN